MGWIIISESTAAGAPMLAALELDLIRVKGKNRPARIYALVGDEGVAANPAFTVLKTCHDALLRAYRARDWSEAQRLSQACRAVAPDLMHGYYQHYEERIAEYEAAPRPADWDGVFLALTK